MGIRCGRDVDGAAGKGVNPQPKKLNSQAVPGPSPETPTGYPPKRKRFFRRAEPKLDFSPVSTGLMITTITFN